MSSVNYENQILTAIETLVDSAVQSAGYDKTIKATIINQTNAAIGEYKVKYQDSVFYAYSIDTAIVYPKDTLVYIQVPGNDMKQVKTIIGAVNKDDIDYTEVLETEDYYDAVGGNSCNSETTYGLCSYNGETNITLYDRDNSINLVNYDEDLLKTNLNEMYNIICGAWFKTALADEQKKQGNYGITFDIDFYDDLDNTKVITKTYTIDVNNIEGNPYNLLSFIRQIRIFEIKSENYVNVKKIGLFCKGFPNTEVGHENDIFIKMPILQAAREIPEVELNGYSVKIETDKSYFNSEDAEDAQTSISAIAKIKGHEIGSKRSVQYYWFRENSDIYPTMTGYNTYGGAGWECLNEYNILDSTTGEIEYITNNKTLTIAKTDCVATDNKYKVVVIFNENGTVEADINIKNYSSAFTLSIASDEGTEFYYGNGSPTLTLLINGVESPANYTYKWAKEDNNGLFENLEETTSVNSTYNTLVSNYNTLLASVANETVLPNAAKAQLDTYKNQIAGYDEITRVEGKKVYNIQVNEIDEWATYKCTVYNSGDIIGTAAITLNNYPKIEGEFTLNIINGTQTFNYNSAGIAPTSQTLQRPMELKPLSFTIVDNKGNLLPDRILNLCNIHWTVPSGNSLIQATDSTDLTLDYTLAENYDINLINNSNIKLDIQYQELILHAETNFTFIKDGQPGTNGTNIICKIVPYTDDDFDGYPVLYYNGNGTTYGTHFKLNYTPNSNYRWFKLQLWENGSLIWEGVNSQKSGNVIVKWEVLKSNYTSSVSDLSHIRITESSGTSETTHNYSFFFNNIDSNLATYQYAADIIRGEVTYKDKKYYCTLPLITVKTNDWTNFNYELVKNSGFRYVLYTSDGMYPQYESDTPFTLKVTEKINGFTEDISNLTTNAHKLTYNWGACGSSYYNGNWHQDIGLIEQTIAANKGTYVPIEECDGRNVTHAIRIAISQSRSQIAEIHIPVHFYLNRYGVSALNEWDGNHIEINTDKDVILAPQIGAGKKEADNSFTGIFMGDVLEAGNEESKTGLYGYYKGDKTIELNSEDGSAKFGKTGAGQIILDPTDNTAKLKSGNFSMTLRDPAANEKYTNGLVYYGSRSGVSRILVPGTDYTIGNNVANGDKIWTSGSGLEIDLTDPHIIFGSGDFWVGKDGDVHAKEYATIANLQGGAYTIPQSSVENLTTFISQTNNSIDELQNQIDGNITTWFYEYEPALNRPPVTRDEAHPEGTGWTTTELKNQHLGDLFYNTLTGYCYRFMISEGVYSWQQLSDSDISEALRIAQEAQDTADSKRRVFYNTPTPPYDAGDLWVQGSTGDILRCATPKTSTQAYAAVDWVAASKYTDDTLAQSANNKIDNLQIGGRNFVLESNIPNKDGSTDAYLIGKYKLSKNLVNNKQYTWSINIEPTTNKKGVAVYIGGNTHICGRWITANPLSTGTYSCTFIATSAMESFDTAWIYCSNNEGPQGTTAITGTCKLNWVQIEEGNRASDWTPAPEDIENAAIGTVTVLYALGNDTTIAPTTGWSEVAPSWTEGKYMWQKTVITYVNGDTDESDPTCIAGATGKAGTGITYFGTRSWTNAQITDTYIIGYSDTWANQLSKETKVGDLLLLDVTNSTYNTKYEYILEVTIGGTSSQAPTATIVAITKDGDATDIQVGGRNVLWNSRYLNIPYTIQSPYISYYSLTAASVIEREDGFNEVRITTGDSWKGIAYSLNSLELSVGDILTNQFWFRSNNVSGKLSLYAMCYDSGGNRVNGDYLADITYEGDSTTGDSKLLENFTSTTNKKIVVSFKWTQLAQDLIDNGGRITLTFQTHNLTTSGTGYYTAIWKPKTEIGTIATDWSPAAEDTMRETLSNVITTGSPIYCYTTSINTPPLTPDMSGAPTWAAAPPVESGKYLWQTTPVTVVNSLGVSTTTYTTPICLTQPKIVNIVQQYCMVNESSTTQPAENDAGWTAVIPEWKINKKLWVRTATIYDDNSLRTYSNYHIDTTWSASSALQQDLEEANAKLNEITTEGTGAITISGANFYATDASQENRLVINNQGLGFQKKNTQTGEWDTATSVWSLDGTFDAQNINVKNLNAESIVNGDLAIGKNFGNNPNNGVLKIYDEQDHLIIKGSGSDGLAVSATNANTAAAVHTKITPTTGIEGYDNAHNKVYYHDNDKFVANKLNITESITIGSIKIVIINSAEHKGIGFVTARDNSNS